MVGGAKILIAEDDKDIRELLKLYLVSEGYEVICAENGEIALAMAEKERPDIAILDIMMPKTDGLEVVRLLRERA
ncbi:MAG TPA: response regulator [Anaerovoracaceae bacterium]|nr:response regulator [Anaerovoracaceae bacterium]